MKLFPVLSASVVVGLSACDSMNGPISSGSFDPLSPPGSNIPINSNAAGAGFTAGQFVSAAMDNTAFFKQRPRGDADADRMLARDTRMKVVSSDPSYVKVELDSGEVGFVPSVMITTPGADTGAVAPVDGAYQVYPPLPGAGPTPDASLPVFDETGLPPDGAIPTIIDPDAPGGEPAPAAAQESVPLPPGIDEDQPDEAPAIVTPPVEPEKKKDGQ